MKIAIIDDSATDREVLVTLLHMFFEKINLPVDIKEFSSAESFLTTLEPDTYNLCFMDIFMDGMNGMVASQILHKAAPDCMVIFLSSSDQYIGEGYRVRALRYLLKPITAEKIQEFLPECVERVVLSQRLLSVSIGRKERQIPFSKILYALSSAKTEIHLLNTVFTVSSRQTFAQITAPLLEDYRFISCGRGVVVNMAHALRIDKDCFIMVNGDRVPISRRRLSDVSDRFIDFQFEYLI